MEMARRGPPKSDDFDEQPPGGEHDFGTNLEDNAERLERRNRRICVLVTVVIMIIMFTLIVVSSRPESRQTTVVTDVGAVSTTHYLATRAGVEILEAGGNAIDAAAAIQFALGVVQPQSTGIGGGFYALVYHAAEDTVHALDAREEAPAAFHPDIFCGGDSCLAGPTNCTCDPVSWAPSGNWRELVGSGLSVGVPGTVRGVDRMLKEYGTMSLAAVVSPAVTLAREGFPVSDHFVFRTNYAQDVLSLRDASSELYLNGNRNGPKKQAGDTFFNPDLAATMQRLGEVGADDFYQGEIADDIIKTVTSSPNPRSKKNGVMTKEDLSGYKALWRPPVKTTYRGNTVYGMGPSTGGGITLAMMLNYIEGIELSDFKHNSAQFLRHVIDAQNVAFADRNRYLADEDFVDIPWGQLHQDYCQSHASRAACPVGCLWQPSACVTRGLTTKEYAAQRRANLTDRDRALSTPVPFGEFSPRYDVLEEKEVFKPGTTHLAVSDKWGNVVSMTTTIEDNMGSGIVVPGRGFLLNNEMTDFSWDSSTFSGKTYANRPEGGKKKRRTALGADSETLGGKRPRSSMTPTIIFDPDHRPLLAIGSPGGSRITGTVFGSILAVLDSRLPPLEALEAPRALSRNGQAELENTLMCHCEDSLYDNAKLKAQLANLDVSIKVLNTTEPFTYVQMIMWNRDGLPVGYADPRMESGLAQQARVREQAP